MGLVEPVNVRDGERVVPGSFRVPWPLGSVEKEYIRQLGNPAQLAVNGSVYLRYVCETNPGGTIVSGKL